jgi:type I restriction enzyme S subunit
MASPPKAKIATVAKVISGFAFKSEEFQENGIPVIKIKNIRLGSVDRSAIQCVPEKYLSLDPKYHVRPGDILISLTGSHINQPNSVVGRVARFPKSFKVALLNQRAGKFIITAPDKCDPSYLYHHLVDEQTRRDIASFAHGAANQANVSPNQVASLKINLPSLPTQRKIAAILSAYDDLIENNLRRIKILEEMAQALYREWFVKFRFPGHEKTRMVDSPLGKIPEGWDVTTLDSVLSVLESGSRPKGGIDPSMRDVPSTGAENILGLGKYDFSKEKYVSREFFEKMKRGHINNGDVLLYKDGAKIGRKSMFRDNFPHSECCINEHVFILRTNEKCGQAYLFFWLDQPDITAGIINLNANAAQPGINQKGVKGLPILLPDRKFLDLFDEFVELLLAELFNLAKKNQVLRRTRDLLLPKLISGELVVSELEIETEGIVNG